MTTTTVTPSLEEYEATLADHTKVVDLIKNGTFGDWVRGYAEAKNSASPNIETAVREETQKVLLDMMRDNGVPNVQRLNLHPGDGFSAQQARKNRLYNVKAPGAQLDKQFTDSAEYFQAIWHHANTLPNSDELKAKTDQAKKIQNSYGSTVPADGGFLIPEQLRSELLQVALESSIVRSRARVIPMDTLRVPIPMIDSSSNASSVFGGIVAYWTEEGASLTESQASFGRVVLEAKKLTAYAEMPNELIADATAFTGFFDQIYPEALAWYEDKAFISGSGTGEPLGYRNAGSKITVTQAGGTPNIVYADIVNMFSRMLPSSLSRAVWIASIDTFPALATMELSAGSPATWVDNLREDRPMTILGRPVIFTEKTPASGSAGQLGFVDFGYYLIGDRQVMQASSSPHYKFANDKTAFRIIERVDGRPWLNQAITPANGSSSTLSPFVELGASQ